ncbi:MAG: threonylcarbamoyl-AMP synthase [Clostridia bacterium]|nr:threonylcarbamoyl-AMP synthase [Clostridia bacterium]
MRVKKYDKTEFVSSKDVEAVKAAAKHLHDGEVVGFPTETVYGLGANAFDRDAVDKIFEAKGRPGDNPLIVHIADKSQINELVSEITPVAQKLIDAFMPGPITVIMRKSDKIPSNVTAGLDTVGIRMPSKKEANDFLRFCDCPVAAPSANISGSPSPTRADHVMADMDGYVYAVVDGGEADYGLESTVVDATGTVPVVLRPGAVTGKMISEALETNSEDNTTLKKGETPKAPGMKYRHYAPHCSVEIIDLPNDIELINDETLDTETEEDTELDFTKLSDDEKKEVLKITLPFMNRIREILNENPLARIGVFAGVEVKASLEMLRDDNIYYHTEFFVYGRSADTSAASHCLFDGLRELDVNKTDIILAMGFNGDGISKAYMNRLKKAAYKSGDMPDSVLKGDDLNLRSKRSLDSFKSTCTASVLFICDKNRNLSIAAEALFRDIIKRELPYCSVLSEDVGAELYADSCGINAIDGDMPDEFTLKALKEAAGIDASYLKALRGSPSVYDDSDIIICLREDTLQKLIHNFPPLENKAYSLSSYAANCGLVVKNEQGKVLSVSLPDPTGENYVTHLHTVKAIKAYLELLFPYILKDLGVKRI